ncbi:hypothetical protein [uncultured Deinococcus sp.]|uniref:hypothetical protein n=1 Tax=uncultured Deinococcus sp. TaxID=158789 RepID=UPI002582D36E|nr:hypothetical protein [uncultured Deinococcus sp.]
MSDRQANLETLARCLNTNARREAIAQAARRGEVTLQTIGLELPAIETNTLYRQIRILEHADILEARSDRTGPQAKEHGRRTSYRLTPQGVQAIRDLYAELAAIVHDLDALTPEVTHETHE